LPDLPTEIVLSYNIENDIVALKSGPIGTEKPPSSFKWIFIPLSRSNDSRHATNFLKFLISDGQADPFRNAPTDPVKELSLVALVFTDRYYPIVDIIRKISNGSVPG
jgi:hypothetical protein